MYGSDVFLTLSWKVNDTLLNKLCSNLRCNPMANNTNEPNILISRLKITAARECNQTEVHCVVVRHNFSSDMTTNESSFSAVLYVQGKLCQLLYIYIYIL